MSRFCENCGNQLPENTSFCPECGTQVENGSVVQEDQQPEEQSEYQQYGVEDAREKKSGKVKGCLINAVLIIAVLAFVFNLIGGFFEIIWGFFDKKDSGSEIKALTSVLPTVLTRVPEGGGYITSFGGVYFAVPMGYYSGSNDTQYVINGPDAPKKIDTMTITYDGTYDSSRKNEVLEQYKEKFDKVATVATKKTDAYRLYCISGKKKVGKKTCRASCLLMLKDDEMYSVEITSNLKESRLGLAAEYLAFNPSTSFD